MEKEAKAAEAEQERLAAEDAARVAAEAEATEAEQRRLEEIAIALRRKVNAYLLHTPKDLTPAQLENWQALKPVDCDVFDNFWSRVTPDDPFSYLGLRFDQGVVRREYKDHGPKRFIEKKFGTSQFITSTYNEGIKHGLYIRIQEKEINIWIHNNSKLVFRLHFTKQRVQKLRFDPNKEFEDL